MAGLREIIAYNLKEKRRKRGLTQAALAEKVEVSTHHIGMLEIARNYPTLELVERIAGALDIEIYELFVDPLSSHEELDRLYRIVANDIEKVVGEAVQKTLSAMYAATPGGPCGGREKTLNSPLPAGNGKGVAKNQPGS